MDESSAQPGRWRTIGLLMLRVPVYLFVFVTMYVLSIGPMYWRWYESYAMHESHEEALIYADHLSLFYLPLVHACDANRHLGEYVNWYIDFWI